MKTRHSDERYTRLSLPARFFLERGIVRVIVDKNWIRQLEDEITEFILNPIREVESDLID